MLRPTAITVVSLKNYHLLITFDNGEIRKLNVAPFIKGDWYGNLKDTKLFKTATTDGYTIVWDEGQDLCPDDVYYGSDPIGTIEDAL